MYFAITSINILILRPDYYTDNNPAIMQDYYQYIVTCAEVRVPYILAYKSKNFGHFFALQVKGSTYQSISQFMYTEGAC